MPNAHAQCDILLGEGVRDFSGSLTLDLLRGFISRSNTGLPRAKKDVKCNSSLVPRSNTMITVDIFNILNS